MPALSLDDGRLAALGQDAAAAAAAAADPLSITLYQPMPARLRLT